MADERKKIAIGALTSGALSLATDASNDISDKKLFPLVITYFCKADGEMKTNLLSLLESSDSTGEGIYNMINRELSSLNIWDRCVSFSCDNAYNMVGKNKGVAAFLLASQPHIKVVGCCCHLIHCAVKKSTKDAIPIDIEFFIVQIYYYLEKSNKRKYELTVYQQLCGEKFTKY